MYALIFVLLLILLAVIAFAVHLESSSMRVDRHSTINVVRITAQHGAQVFNACAKEPVGEYSVAQLISDKKLPTGYAQSTALGPQWACQVSSGGVGGGNVVLMLLNGPFTNLPGAGSLPSQQVALQANVAWNLAQDIEPQVVAMSNVVVGILPARSTTMTSVVDGQQYDLAGLVNAPSYETPVIAENLVSSSLS